MKTANNIFYILIIISFTCCTNKSFNGQNKNTLSVINYDADSVYYKIDVKDDGNPETFLVCKNYIVGDSLIGSYNDANRKKAYQLISENKNFDKFRVMLLYNIFYLEDSTYKKISTIKYDDDLLTYPILKQGLFSDKIIFRKNLKREGIGYLKIMEVSDYSYDCRVINMIYSNHKWQVFSKEIINNQGTFGVPTEYSLDTMNIDFNFNKIYFPQVFE